jgi:hypothetical protein
MKLMEEPRPSTMTSTWAKMSRTLRNRPDLNGSRNQTFRSKLRLARLIGVHQEFGSFVSEPPMCAIVGEGTQAWNWKIGPSRLIWGLAIRLRW